MSTQNQKECQTGGENVMPRLARGQMFREETFIFPDKDMEQKLLKILEKDSEIRTFKEAVFFTEVMKEESGHYEWNTSLKMHNNLNAKYDQDCGLHLNQDVPDIEKLSPGKYKLILKYYNPYKPRKNKVFGCVDTKSFIFEKLYKGAEGGKEQNQVTYNQAPALPLDSLGNVVQQVNRIFHETINLHSETLTFREQIEQKAFEKGYSQRLKEEELEKKNRELEERLKVLENGGDNKTEGIINTVTQIIDKLGIKIPKIDEINEIIKKTTSQTIETDAVTE